MGFAIEREVDAGRKPRHKTNDTKTSKYAPYHHYSPRFASRSSDHLGLVGPGNDWLHQRRGAGAGASGPLRCRESRAFSGHGSGDDRRLPEPQLGSQRGGRGPPGFFPRPWRLRRGKRVSKRRHHRGNNRQLRSRQHGLRDAQPAESEFRAYVLVAPTDNAWVKLKQQLENE